MSLASNHKTFWLAQQNKWVEQAAALSRFIGYDPIFDTLSPEEQERLRERCETMWENVEAIESRINPPHNPI